MPLDLMKLPAAEAEALAYAEGFTGTASLFARIADLQKALGEAIARAESLECDLRAAQFVNRYERAFPQGDE
jgi:hypothetical protein